MNDIEQDDHQPPVKQPRLDHWPHAAEHAKRNFDPERIEAQAVRIVARGLRTQRLVAFVGSGASMAYGRLTWEGLLQELHGRLDRRPAHLLPGWETTKTQVWANKLSYFLKDPKTPLKAQVLSNAFDQDAETAQASELQRATCELLKDFHSFTDLLVTSLLKESAADAGSLMATWQKARDNYLAEANTAAKPVVLGLGGVVHNLHKIQEGLVEADFDFSEHNRKARPNAAALAAILDALRRHSIEEDSSIRLLACDWGVRRFITTNYDTEIERSLKALEFKLPEAASAQDNTFEALSLSRQSTGETLCFGVEGPRRNAAVLHIHGVVDKPETLIITEADYQRLYLQDHLQRDLVNNATLASFAANPILFVGSGVNEDDVLRPMRQFMTGPGHRSDRMAVALLLATRKKHERAQQKLDLLLRFGVHAIHAGEAWLAPGAKPTDKDKEPWFQQFHEVYCKFQELVKSKQDSGKFRHQHVCNKIAHVALTLGQLVCPDIIEGQPAQGRLAIGSELAALHAALQEFPEASDTRLKGGFSSFEFRRLALLFEVTHQRVSSVFACAKLMSLRNAALSVVKDDLTLAQTYRRVMPTVSTPLVVHQRHAISLKRAEFAGRFQRTSANGAFDEGIGELMKAIQQSPTFATERRRRLIVVCGARGMGKGSQFDRLLLEVTDDKGHSTRPELAPVLKELHYPFGHAPDGERSATVLHFNLSFSDELGAVIRQVSDVLNKGHLHDTAEPPPCHDQLEMLERGLKRLAQRDPTQSRLLIMLGNAGVLFDAQGRSKNGQIRRVIRLFRSRRFAQAPLDVVMYVGESQVPDALRKPAAEATATPDALARTVMSIIPDKLKDSWGLPKASDTQAHRADDAVIRDDRLRRRLDRLNIQTRVHKDERDHTLIFPLAKTRVEKVAGAYFPGLVEALQSPSDDPRLKPQDAVDQLMRSLHFATGGSRYAQTLILAYLDWVKPHSHQPAGASQLYATANELVTRLQGSPAGSAVETVIEVVLDAWARIHLLQMPPPSNTSLPFAKGSDPLTNAMQHLSATPSIQVWHLAKELLWHLSAFSHPVEAVVLIACPEVRRTLQALHAIAPQLAEPQLLEAVLELLVHWCLIFRVDGRFLPKGVDPSTSAKNGYDYRYAPHRHMQRHFLRLMGGRNVESTQWDQFTTTMYASQPDELPSLRPLAQCRLSAVVETLTHYPAAEFRPHPPPQRNHESMLIEAARIRAAYYLVRSTYSLGVVSHYSAESPDSTTGSGHMESYRRLVRWIGHAAQYWETEYQAQRKQTWSWSPTDPTSPQPTELNTPKAEAPMGIFYPGELVWLYNEAGVISLAQGKLNDAEQLLSMAELAARRMEADETGSIHARIRLHTALTQIERGRPHQARQILRPIAERRGGHPVPPLLARFYLGLLEHIGGNQRTAKEHYDYAFKGLQICERSRATAFVLMGQADLQRVMTPDHPDAALALADEAISLAEQGGHEDLRVLALLARVRIGIEARAPSMPSTFEQLSYAERYSATMDMPRVACEVHELRARVLLQQGEYRLSASEVTTSLEIAALYDLKLMKARGLLTLAQVYQKRRELSGARAMAKMGKEIAASADYYSCVRGFHELELTMNQAPPSHGLLIRTRGA